MTHVRRGRVDGGRGVQINYVPRDGGNTFKACCSFFRRQRFHARYELLEWHANRHVVHPG